MISLRKTKADNKTWPLLDDQAAIQSLAVLLILAQVPHMLHLPLWISATGVGIVALRLFAQKKRTHRRYRLLFSGPSIAILALSLAALIYLNYGYFIGRDPCVGFLFLLVACKFAELRRSADATLLMCLSGFLLLTQYFYSQTILSALVTVPAVFALGNALSMTRSLENRKSTGHNMQLIGKLLVQGAPLALLLFLVFPRLPGPLWSLPEDATAKTGLSDTMSPGSISNLSQSDEVAFRVEFVGNPPPMNQRYFRGPVLPNFDGTTWTTDETLTEVLPKTADSNSLEYTVLLQPHQQQWLFALEQPLKTREDFYSRQQNGVNMHYTVDGQLLSRKPVTSLTRYTVASKLSSSYKAQRPPPRNTRSLPGKNTRTIAHAKKLYQNSASAEQYANNVMQWFSKERFSYTLTPSLLGDKPVDEFLFDTQEGFCEHYAQAFVVMMRAAGIPSRVVTGYLGGKMNGDYMIVRQSDAHAWAETYINGYWHRFDPTGAVAPSRVESGLSQALPEWEPVSGLSREDGSLLNAMQLKWDALNHGWQRMVVDFDNKSQLKILEKLGIPKPSLWQITALVIALSAIWCAMILGLPFLNRSRSRKQLPEAEYHWQKYTALLKSNGVIRGRAETPTEFIERAAQALPSNAKRIRDIGDALMTWRFARLTASEENRLRENIKTLLPRRTSASLS